MIENTMVNWYVIYVDMIECELNIILFKCGVTFNNKKTCRKTESESDLIR